MGHPTPPVSCCSGSWSKVPYLGVKSLSSNIGTGQTASQLTNDLNKLTLSSFPTPSSGLGSNHAVPNNSHQCMQVFAALTPGSHL